VAGGQAGGGSVTSGLGCVGMAHRTWLGGLAVSLAICRPFLAYLYA